MPKYLDDNYTVGTWSYNSANYYTSQDGQFEIKADSSGFSYNGGNGSQKLWRLMNKLTTFSNDNRILHFIATLNGGSHNGATSNLLKIWFGN